MATVTIDQAISATRRNVKAFVTEVVQDIMEAAQTPQISMSRSGTFEVGKIPVDTSALIQSLESGLNDTFSSAGQASYTVAVASYELGDTMSFQWTMPYAARIEYGFTGTDSAGRSYNMPGRYFIGANVLRANEFAALHEDVLKG